jgi:Putative adhesin
MMKIRTRTFPGLFALVLSLAATMASRPAQASDDGHFDRTLAVTGAVDLDVQTGSGEITVRTGDSSKLEIHGRIHASHGWFGPDAEQRIHEIEANPPIEQNGNTIRVGHIENHDWKNNISISYELVVPVQTKLRSESGSGDQVIAGIAGPADASSGSGSVRLSNIGGETHARTGSGDIELNGIQGTAKVVAGSGSIRAIGIAGALAASSGSGSVKFEQTAAGDVEIGTGSGDVEVKGAKGALKVQTGSGSIIAQGDPTGDWRLHTGSGDVTVELPQQAAFNLVARTSSGSIDSSREIAVQGKLSPRELQGKVGGGGPTVELSTSSGSIQIR